MPQTPTSPSLVCLMEWTFDRAHSRWFSHLASLALFSTRSTWQSSTALDRESNATLNSACRDVSHLIPNSELLFTLSLFHTALSRPAISISLPTDFVTSEDVGSSADATGSIVSFQISGSFFDVFHFALVPLTYQEFETITGMSVGAVFARQTVPTAAANRGKVLQHRA